MPPPLPGRVVPDAAMKVVSRVGVNPVLVGLLESEVPPVWGVACPITPLPLPVRLIQRLVTPAPLIRYTGICLGRSGVVTTQSFSFTFPSSTRLSRPLTFPVSIWYLCYLYFVCCLSRQVWGALLEQCPRHPHDTKVQSPLQHSHRAVLHVNVCPSFQQAPTAGQSNHFEAAL